MMNANPRKQFLSAFPPLPRSFWSHPDVPLDDFDRVCQVIWSRAKETEEALGRGQSSAERGPIKDRWAPDNTTSHRPEEQQKKTHDFGPSTRYEKDKQQNHTDFISPYPYPFSRRHPYVPRAKWVRNSVMEEEMKQNDEEVKGKKQEDTGDKQRSVENSLKEIWVPQSSSRRDKQSFAPKPQPLATNPICSATEDLPPQLQDEEDPPLPSTVSRDTSKSEDEENIVSRSDSLDDDFETLLGVLRCAIDSSDDDSESENNGCKGEGNAPQANLKNNASPAAPTQQVPYDLLADFPLLQPQKKPFALGVLHDGDPKAKGAKGKRELTHWTNQHQESRAFHQSRMENVPHEVSSICAGEQKSVLDLQTFGSTGQRIPPTISCEELKAKTQPPPRGADGTANAARSWASVAEVGLKQAATTQEKARPFTSPQKVTINRAKVVGADGVDVTARSWASVAKVGLKQAAAPQEKARPFTSPQKVTINRAKAGYSATPNTPNKMTPSYQEWATTPMCPSPRPRNPKWFVGPGYPPIHQHFGAQAYRANGPPGFRCPRFPFQQARGNPSKHSHT